MPHESKDTLLSLFYQELPALEEQRIREHLAGCADCREYMRSLNRMNATLNHWPETNPAPNTFERILVNIPPERLRVSYVRPAVSARPIFNIVFAMISILLLIYFVQSKVSMLSLWESLSQYWIVQTLGSFGFVALAFLGIGTFVTLALAPILYFDLNKRTLHI